MPVRTRSKARRVGKKASPKRKKRSVYANNSVNRSLRRVGLKYKGTVCVCKKSKTLRRMVKAHKSVKRATRMRAGSRKGAKQVRKSFFKIAGQGRLPKWDKKRKTYV